MTPRAARGITTGAAQLTRAPRLGERLREVGRHRRQRHHRLALHFLLRHPLLALEKVSAVAGDMLILETHVDLTVVNRPAMAFYAGSELNGDPSNWCGPNEACVIAMLLEVGFKRAEVYSRTYDPTQPPDFTSLDEPRGNRAVFHAWK